MVLGVTNTNIDKTEVQLFFYITYVFRLASLLHLYDCTFQFDKGVPCIKYELPLYCGSVVAFILSAQTIRHMTGLHL